MHKDGNRPHFLHRPGKHVYFVPVGTLFALVCELDKYFLSASPLCYLLLLRSDRSLQLHSRLCVCLRIIPFTDVAQHVEICQQSQAFVRDGCQLE